MLPRAQTLYFWALQASFHYRRALRGAAHLGLQWCPERVSGRYVNWGGYDADGTVLPGSHSRLPSRTGNPNTRDYPWLERRPYRLRIHGGRHDTWTGEVSDLTTGTATVVRDLFVAAPHLSEPVVWSEVFADCDAPSVSVRWSHMTARTAGGRELSAQAVRVGYQSRVDGGCDNTTALADGTGVVQVTNTARKVAEGARLGLLRTV